MVAVSHVAGHMANYDNGDDGDSKELKILGRKRAILDQMSQSADDASTRAALVEELCARGAIDEASAAYETLRKDAAVSGEIGWGIGFALAVAARVLGEKRVSVDDLSGAAVIVDDLVMLAGRQDLGPNDGVGLVTSTSGLADALIGAGELDVACRLVTAQAHGVALSPMMDFAHAGSVARLLAAYLDAGRIADARRAHELLVVRGRVKIEIEPELVARIGR